QLDAAGTAGTELIRVAEAEPDGGERGRPLLRLLVRDGEIVGREPLAAARERHRAAVAELPGYARQLSRGYPAIPTVFEPDAD
ncbi:MAG TPA: nicotinate phosphoribosyltransferase, partial [Streptosporangiaceae bacterium]|nr:nicotinate phosphoribosyltransferase [Streptosporangiaceae bacterium]